ncbi:hypothetical protein NDU88_001327 [Pleurodeles waltl]|uniref:Uncharacterized protein n=1 Tax=Pleurodeles waltl TaxID=8319 RepID=A0AAV7VBK7_PLEWA|nr:hypothetical protein NDU88_001327 [Pleurodeles waltl]
MHVNRVCVCRLCTFGGGGPVYTGDEGRIKKKVSSPAENPAPTRSSPPATPSQRQGDTCFARLAAEPAKDKKSRERRRHLTPASATSLFEVRALSLDRARIVGPAVPVQRHCPQACEEFCATAPAWKTQSSRKTQEGICRGTCRDQTSTRDGSIRLKAVKCPQCNPERKSTERLGFRPTRQKTKRI